MNSLNGLPHTEVEVLIDMMIDYEAEGDKLSADMCRKILETIRKELAEQTEIQNVSTQIKPTICT